MKKYLLLPLVLLLSTVFFSFWHNRGGDVLRIYLNGRQVHQQFVNISKTTEAPHLSSLNKQDKIEVFYSHCGQAGKSRVLTFKNAMNQTIKELKFPDSSTNRSFMSFYRRDVSKDNPGTIKLFYSSKEIPNGKLLAILSWREKETTAKTASL